MATLTRLDATHVELEVAIPDEELEEAREKAYRLLVRNTRIPGFRPGKAPRRVFEQQYGSQKIEEKALEEVFPRVYMQALEEHELHPLENPSFDWLPREENHSGLHFKAIIRVRPQIDLVDYSAIKLDASIPKATDEEIHQALESLRRERATLVPVERPAKLGDVVVVDYKGTIDGEPFSEGTATAQQVELLTERFIPGFAEGIVGLSAGESRSIEAVFPESYLKPTLARKTAIFEITLHEVKEREFPELDGDFAAKFLPNDPTIDAMRIEIAKQIERANTVRIKKEQGEILIEKLLELHEFSLPELLVEQELEAAVRTRELETVQANRSWQDYLKEQGKDEETLRAELRDEAMRRVKTMLIVEEIARKENITVTSAEIDAELGELAAMYGQTKERIREAIGKELHGFTEGIIRSKALNLLLDRALGLVSVVS